MQEFTRLVKSKGLVVQDHVLDTIARTPAFTTQLNVCRNADDAVHLYALASTVLHTKTRNLVERKSGIVVDGLLPVVGVQTAMFFYAFKGTVPSVLKVPVGASGKAQSECRLYTSVESRLHGREVFLVPVSYVGLDGQYSVTYGDGTSDSALVRAGIFMPLYGCTLETLPSLTADDALEIVTRMSATLDFLHDCNWLHGDVKPSNIFIDHVGKAWLGDYGSSVQFSSVESFTGGTPAFQCVDVSYITSPERFDRTGLAISLLCKLGVLQISSSSQNRGWHLEAVVNGISRVGNEPLKTALTNLLFAAIAA